MSTDLDHLSIAVQDIDKSLKLCITKLGARPIIGGVHPSFTYVLLETGRSGTNKRLELISEGSASDTFMHRYLSRHGERAHHICFLVDDIEQTIADLEGSGFELTGIDLTNPGWKEAFIIPDSLHSLVIQIASKKAPYPDVSLDMALQGSEAALNPNEFPNNRGVKHPLWWLEAAAQVKSGETLPLGPVLLKSTNLSRSRELFTDLLNAESSSVTVEFDGRAVPAMWFRWPSGDLVVVQGDEPGVCGIATAEVWAGPQSIGEVPFLRPVRVIS